jgi:hypothetical protein
MVAVHETAAKERETNKAQDLKGATIRAFKRAGLREQGLAEELFVRCN